MLFFMMKSLYIIFISCITNLYAYTQDNLRLQTKIKFQETPTDTNLSPAHSRIKEIRAVRTSKILNIDGIIDEPEWMLAAASPHFIQVDPEQGKPALFNTQVKVLYNQQY